jgi:phage/conjugal plasmid C-4 type zinc finger TraR family protein
MDQVDIANDKAEQFIADSLRSARVKVETAPSTGICKTCNQEIPQKRLLAVPTSHQCSHCASEEEEDERRSKKTGSTKKILLRA